MARLDIVDRHRERGQHLKTRIGMDLVLRRTIGNASLRALGVSSVSGGSTPLLRRDTLGNLELDACTCLIAEAVDYHNTNESDILSLPSGPDADHAFSFHRMRFDGTNGIHSTKMAYNGMRELVHVRNRNS